MDVPGYLAERSPLVEAHLRSLLVGTGEPLREAMAHLLFPGGKRLRPALAFATAEALGRKPQAVLPVAAAVELIHTYSLIHDDLPCMDDDDERRGRPTVHVRFGEAVAVLAGDALLALAFEALATPGVPSDPPVPAAVLAAVGELARAAGACGLVGGQVDDLACEPQAPDARRIESIHERKSAALIAVSIAAAARLAGAPPERIEGLARSGREVGVAFQIADDLLDRDEDDGCSLVRAVGEPAARKRAEELLASALARLDDLGDAAEPLRALMRFAVHRDV